MENQQQILESSGENVEKAIEVGLSELRLGRDEVEVEVLDEGSSGILGLGRRAAKVRLTVAGQRPAVETGRCPIRWPWKWSRSCWTKWRFLLP